MKCCNVKFFQVFPKDFTKISEDMSYDNLHNFKQRRGFFLQIKGISVIYLNPLVMQ